MSLYQFRLPDVGEGVAEAEITAWHVNVGDVIDEDQPLADVMTDKATVEMTSPVAGAVKAVYGALGEIIAVGSTLVEIERDGEQSNASSAENENAAPERQPAVNGRLPGAMDQQTIPESSSATLPVEALASAQVTSPGTAPTPPASRSGYGAAPSASPSIRRRARELGVALEDVSGTGRAGRITTEDFEKFVARNNRSAGAHGLPQRTGVEEIKVMGLRRKIAEKMQLSKSRIPHFSYVEEFDMTELEALRKALNEERKEGQPKLTLLPFFMRALVILQAEFPMVNARYDDQRETLLAYEGVHIGIATQTDGGLMVPVVRHAETLSLWRCAEELLRVTAAARNGKASRDEISGSTITLTSLGALGGIAATPVINAPEVAIIGPNKLVERPVIRNGRVEARTMMNLSSSFDHRIIDGYDAARFVQALKRLIECPAKLFLGSS